jgi:hypothetical protein
VISDAVVAVIASLPYAERAAVAGLRHLGARRDGHAVTTAPEETPDVTSVTLSDRQRLALLALDELGTAVRGIDLADRMSVLGMETSVGAAHTAANGLARKGLAVKRASDGGLIRYQITEAGRSFAGQLRSTS